MNQKFSGSRHSRKRATRLAATAIICATVASLSWAGTSKTPIQRVLSVVPVGVDPAPTPSPTPTPPVTPALPPVSSGAAALPGLGINVGSSVYWNSERSFANLAFAAARWRDPAAGWGDVTADKLTANGYPKTGGVLTINVPQTVWVGAATRVDCTWTGSGNVRIDGDTTGRAVGHQLSFTWPGRVGTALPTILLYVDSIRTADPFDNLDCREPGLATNGVFDQRIVDDLKPYELLRFLDWSTANANPATVAWEARSVPTRLTQDGVDGIALEHMIDLANATDSDAWFTVPWNADEAYVRSMALLVHARLSRGHRAYFELSNETWNFGFGVATQSLNEGLAANLSSDRYTNNLLRYAEKSTWMHKILTSVFADKPQRLVRVLNIQNGNSWGIDQIMGFRDTAQWVDAIATAPYFGHELFTGPTASVTDLPTLFGALEASRVHTLALALSCKTTAVKWGKRYIAYEGGQHIVPPANNDAAAAAATQMQRSPLMYDIYKRYMSDWQAQIGDNLTMYSATGAISKYGSWGIREHGGQPLSETPKRRAVLEYGRQTNNSVQALYQGPSGGALVSVIQNDPVAGNAKVSVRSSAVTKLFR